MHDLEERKGRLKHLLDLASNYRGWSWRRLAKELQRDRARLCPPNADPKLSYLLKLGEILEWPIETVSAFIWTGLAAKPEEELSDNIDFHTNYAKAYSLRVSGDYRAAIEAARLCERANETTENRARAFNLEFACWDALGLYQPANRAIRRALALDGTSERLQMLLRGNLAIGLLGQNDLVTADALAESTLNWFKQDCRDPIGAISLAFAHYAHATAHRRLAARYPDRMTHHMSIAVGEFRTAETHLTLLSDELQRTHLAGIAHTCRGGRLEAEAALGFRPAARICDEMLEEIETALSSTDALRGDWLESLGWWTVGGGNIALRHLRGQAMQAMLERFADQAIGIARRMDNWAFRERALSMEHTLRSQISHATGLQLRASINSKDIRWITGTMGRFPNFQQTGWEILQDARLIRS